MIRSTAAMETHGPGFFQTLLCVVCVCVCVRCGGVLVCHYCPLQARGRCRNITTECAPSERCFTGWRHYGPVLVLAGQGCASPELCGSNHTHTLMGVEYQISYTCCARDLCNEAHAQGNRLQERVAVTGSCRHTVLSG
ncbi:protein Bouncer-like [Rhinichthys klamathensis goyatoka]|uniref:protein Bouncer-like n=1 Tax=Rhinichthys klamathensis goyatoka TaxID=3034132 RepID=UPI0024B4EC4B|nr:protein Bouncer-like [Rhinichthys klamathensis goyatoka]